MIPEVRFHKSTHPKKTSSKMEQMLYQNHLYEYVFAFVRRYLRDVNEAEEVTQDTIVRAFVHFEQFNAERGRFRSWIKGIALHRIFDRKRAHTYINVEQIPERAHQAPSPEEKCNMAEQKLAFLGALDQLKERERRVLFEMYIEGKSHKDIAASIGISVTNASTLISRARKQCLGMYERKLSQGSKTSTSSVKFSNEAEAFSDMLGMFSSRMWRYDLKQLI